MKKKNIIIAAGLAALIAVGATTALTVTANGGLGKVFASITTNEYGCEKNCTGEYYPSSVNSIVKANTELSGTPNVRLIAKKSKGNSLFQDIDYGYTVENEYVWRKHNEVIMVNSFNTNGFSIKDVKENDTVAFFGTVVFRENVKFGQYNSPINLVEISNATIYMINEVKNLSLLPDVVYLQ